MTSAEGAPATTLDLAALEARIAAIAEERGRAGFEGRGFEGRGIVLAAGGARIFTNAYVLVSILRRTLGCRLPIEIWHFGREELSPAMAATLDGFDVALIDARAVMARAGTDLRDGWQLKPFALLWSRLAEVLLLDADQVPTIDPAALFAWPQYQAAGAVFWPDIVDLRADNPAWRLLGLEGEATASFESGQVLVDKRRHLEALAATLALNERAELLYRHVYGDKDTFLLGWRLAAAPLALVPHRPFVDERALFQRDFDGRPIFQHRSGSKWAYGGEQARLPGFVHEEACLAALEALRAEWNGRVFNPPPRSARARAVERALLQVCRFRLEIADEASVPLTLKPHGELGAGREYDRQNWYVADPPEGEDWRPTLVFVDGERRSHLLHPAGPDAWAGRRFRSRAEEILLRPEPADKAEPVDPAGPGLVDDLLRAAAFAASDPGEDAALGRTLALVARIEPGVAARLHRLADRCAARDPRRASRLRALAASVDAEALPDAPLDAPLNALRELHDHRIIDAGYSRLDEVRD